MCNGFIVVVVILGGIIVMTLSGVVLALKCPNCKKWFALVWQDVQQRDICKYCAWVVEAKDFTPPKASWLKWLKTYSPLKEFKIKKKK